MLARKRRRRIHYCCTQNIEQTVQQYVMSMSAAMHANFSVKLDYVRSSPGSPSGVER